MPLDNTIALLSLEDFKAIAGIKTDENPADDEAISIYINAASKTINDWTGRLWISGTATDEMFPGTGTYAYYVKNGNLLAVSSAPRYWNGASWTSTTDSYTTDLTNGKVYFTKGGSFFAYSQTDWSYPNWKITYTYGYSQINLPAPLKLACAGMVQLMIKLHLENMIGVTSETRGDLNTGYIIHQMPDNIRLMLAPYRRMEFK